MTIWFRLIFTCLCGCFIKNQSLGSTIPNEGKPHNSIPQQSLNSNTQDARKIDEFVYFKLKENLVLPETSELVQDALNLLPTEDYCGKQQSDDYFSAEKDTSINEFPWMVYIVTETQIWNNNNKFESNIGVGAIISNRYVLSEKRDYTRSSIHIGVHHLLNDRRCIPTEFGNDCTDEALIIPVEKFFYRETSTVALLRVSKTIIYNDYVRPICLPYAHFGLPKTGDTILTSGWGSERFIEGLNLQVKKRLKHTVLDKELCKKRNPVQNPICGFIFKNSTKFVCPGDNGGPIMYKYRNNWIVEAIISGNTACVKHQPVSGERITQETIDWIKTHIEP